MASVVTDACRNCAERYCVAVCPLDLFVTEAAAAQVYIDAAGCIECLCCNLECPHGAIFAESALPPEKRAWSAINRAKAASPTAIRVLPASLPPYRSPDYAGRCAATVFRAEGSAPQGPVP